MAVRSDHRASSCVRACFTALVGLSVACSSPVVPGDVSASDGALESGGDASGVNDVRDAAFDALDASPAVDVASADASALDGANDTSMDNGADAPADAGARDAMNCPPVTEPPSPGGVCDGRGRIACQTWASAMVTSGVAYAQCVSSPSGCARASSCTDFADPSTCRCGREPACAEGQVCAGATTGDVPSCRCLRSG